MERDQRVTVFNFRSWVAGAEAPAQPAFKATRERIRSIPGSELLEGTGEQIDPSLLDAQGRYLRVPTGWGTL